MRITPDQALKNFERISRIQLDNPSEADTRSKIIDPILKECLNWQVDDVYREEYANPGFVDYVLKIGEKNVLVIEAKREGASFKLPITFGFVRNYSLGGVLSKEEPVINAITQTRRYCSDKGVRFGVVTNGDQFIIFEAEKPGKDWKEGNCKVFYNYDDIVRHFIDFWNLVSKDAIENGNLINELSRGSEELKFIKPVDDVRFKNEIESRNELYRYMLPIIDRTFKEITDQKDIDMLRECYVLESEFDELTSTLKTHLKKDPAKPSFKEVKQGEEHAGVFHMDFYDKMELLKKSPPEPIICLLLGAIGSGKTTFVFRFFNIVLDEDERETVKWFYVDFRDAPADKSSIRSYILKSILEEFRQKYGDLFNTFLEKLKMEKAEPTIEDLSKLFLMLKYEGYVPSLVVDNVDQHIFESSTYHESVFLEANNLTKELRMITIMTLREESFYRSSRGGVFNAYYIEQYRIMPPDFRKLVLYRLDYILRKLGLPREELQKWLNVSLDFERQLETIKEFLDIVKFTVQQRANRSVARFVSKTSGGNMRRALELFAGFLVSGNTKIREIIETKRREGSYIIAEHQFVKSISLGNYRYYSKNSSYLMNIFDFNQDLCQSHFLKLKLLNYAEDQTAVDSPYGGGYISINRIAEEAADISVSREAIEGSLLELASYGLIVLNTRSTTDLSEASHFRITECGTFFLHLLIMRFSYIDLVLAHTPIADPDVALRIRRMLPSRELEPRFERTQLFLEYLGKMEDREFQNSPEYQLSPLGKYKFTQRMIRNFTSERRYIIESQRRKDYLLTQNF
jgi:predicted type IV restriction endonuclease